MITPRENEPRINYLLRVLDAFMDETVAGELQIDYDGTTCDGACLAGDIRAELDIYDNDEETTCSS